MRYDARYHRLLVQEFPLLPHHYDHYTPNDYYDAAYEYDHIFCAHHDFSSYNYHGEVYNNNNKTNNYYYSPYDNYDTSNHHNNCPNYHYNAVYYNNDLRVYDRSVWPGGSSRQYHRLEPSLCR